MPIVSISVNDDMLKDITQLMKELSFSGRSELVRAGIRSLISEEKERRDLLGLLHALLLVIHDEESEQEVTSTKHTFDDLINTHIHSKIENNKCLEIFLLKGEADKIKNMTKEFQTNKKLDRVKLIPI
ncbi:MAG: CopG family ribbon-helix-helix protein [Nitrososphaerales archaeon]